MLKVLNLVAFRPDPTFSLYEQIPAASAVEALLNRAPNSEFNSLLSG